jgi:deazaflavin-dependent oxidoreductase (nitroreductase family)
MLNRIANSFISRLLRSPFHRLLSRRFMLITVTGRKTGREYTTPVNYVRRGDEVTVLSRKGRTWWLNLKGGGPVMLHIGGEDLAGVGRVEELARAALAEAVQEFYEGLGRHISLEKVAKRAQGRVVIRIKLGGGAG